MAAENASRDATLADVLARIATSRVADKKRDELASAVRTVAKVFGRPLEEIPADANSLRRRLKDISPVTAGVSPGRLANVRSLLRSALEIAGTVGFKPKVPLSPGWSSLYEQPPRWARVRLSRLLRYLSAAGIQPQAVALEHLSGFEKVLTNDPLIKDAAATWRDAAWAWNSAARTFENWPQLPIPMPSRRNVYTLAPTAFPASFNQDVDAYLMRISGEDLLEELPFRPVRNSTREIRKRQLYVAASALVHRGRDPGSTRSLADLVTLDSFKEILRFFTERRGNTSSSQIEQLADFLKSVAKNWVRVEQPALEQLSNVKKRVAVRQQGMTSKNRERLRQFQDGDNVAALLHLPQRLMREAASGRHRPIPSALLAQMAVAIELLLMRPLRIENLVELELEKHLISPKRKSGRWHVIIPGEEVKNDFDLEHELPPESAALLQRYLRDFRRPIAKPGNAALFPGENGIGTKAKNTLAPQIADTVLRYTGCKVNAHLFRHVAGFLHLNAHPGEYGVVAQVLGHKSLNTTKKHYTGMETDAACRHFEKTIADLRKTSAPKKPVSSSRGPRPRNPKKD